MEFAKRKKKSGLCNQIATRLIRNHDMYRLAGSKVSAVAVDATGECVRLDEIAARKLKVHLV